MLFSYYFNSEKTHLLNCHFNVLNLVEYLNGSMDITFNAEIAEVHNGITLKKESQLGVFKLPPTAAGQGKHDIDFTRVRHGDQKKWIFTVVNNKNTTQRVVIGLISDTAQKNPLGMDIRHDNKEFDAELKGNNLSVLEPGYVAPELTQTLVNATFTQRGYPEGFSSDSGSYDSVFQNYSVSEFSQQLLQPIPANTKFKVQVELAPMQVGPVATQKLFDISIPNIGRITLAPIALEYMLEGGYADNVVREFFDAPASVGDFWNNGMTANARMTIEGDGKGVLTVTYNNKTLVGMYDHTLSANRIELKTAPLATTPAKDIVVRLDNLSVIYQK